MKHSASPRFWRDPRMPYVEVRQVEDGREVCYEVHTHRQWSMGAITGGRSTFVYGTKHYEVDAGTLVFMNPDQPHACNPIDNEPWAYLMLYVDTLWLTKLRAEAGLLPAGTWEDTTADVIQTPVLYDRFCHMIRCLVDSETSLLEKQSQLLDYLHELLPRISASNPAQGAAATAPSLQALARFMDSHCMEDLSLDQLSAMAGLSPTQLIRGFKNRFGLTPHAYLVNRRIQLGQDALKRGVPIVQAAMDAGFSDQAHFQRVFKRLVAATPNQYRYPLLKQQS